MFTFRLLAHLLGDLLDGLPDLGLDLRPEPQLLPQKPDVAVLEVLLLFADVVFGSNNGGKRNLLSALYKDVQRSIILKRVVLVS